MLVNTSIALNGAASNPFSSILLVPLVLGLMFLPFKSGFIVLGASILGQSLQLAFPPPQHHGEMMQNHAEGMVLSFILTSLLVTTVIYYFRLQLASKTAAIQQLRERQLRDEQLLAIGTAAAQLTHDAATPVQTMRLILEEMSEAQTPALLAELDSQFSQLEVMLRNWRGIADDVRESRTSEFTPRDLIDSIRHLIILARPEASVSWPKTADLSGIVTGDRTLVPALANVVINACDGGAGQSVNVNAEVLQQRLQLTICNVLDDNHQFPKELLGNRFIASESGFGVGAVLSNATIEKCGGTVSWETSNDMVTTLIELPLHHYGKHTDD
ncbi:hypothetical protein BFC17_14810 [Alteromonas lipolytica]|uniref:Histidine kinase domain-containing protein n=2 Tax=Alteromonas lipolytica TaxID=1856405 RepID=A0A1E8FHF7_9ALTE|nr:hypothetical protein BFC17_14810 [Alteromonas lipolytica]